MKWLNSPASKDYQSSPIFFQCYISDSISPTYIVNINGKLEERKIVREDFSAPHPVLPTDSSPHFYFSYHILNWIFKSRQLIEMENIVQCISIFTVPQNNLKDLLKQNAGPQTETLWFSVWDWDGEFAFLICSQVLLTLLVCWPH